MDIFKTFELLWWQASLFKIALIALGIVIGVTWPTVFKKWRVSLFILFLIIGFYISYVWWIQ